MSRGAYAARVGSRRGVVEFRRSLAAAADVGYYVVGSAVFVVVMWLNRDNVVDGAGEITLSHVIFPNVLAMVLVFGAAYGLATLVCAEREDGTLLRAKTVPHGMTGYVAGQTVRTTLEAAFSLTMIVLPATLIVDGLWANGITAVVGVLGFAALGLLACIPFGFVIGSVFKNARAVGGWGFLIMGGLIWISGLFSPLTSLADWLQPLALALPLYWLGHGMRASVLPDSAAAVELGETWRVLEAVGVLSLWAVIGLVLAPVLLRRMARRESGSAVSARREKALNRV